AQPTFEYFAHGEVTDNDPATAIAVRATFDDVFSDNVIDAKPSTASEDFCYLPQAWGVPYYFWLVGSTPEELLDNPPVNHQSNFIPDFEPTCHSSTQAGAAAVLSFLAKG
ncbi:MAG: amidohydrolase, partial [Corynebacterium casei]